MARYIKQEMPDLTGTGKPKSYYRLENMGNKDTDEVISHVCSHANGISEGALLHSLSALSDALAEFLSQGYTVSLDGIGTFRASVGLRKKPDVGVKSADSSSARLRASSLEINGVGFRPDKSLLKKCDSLCSLTKGGERKANSSPYSEQERMDRLYRYLRDGGNHFIRVREYAEMMRMPVSTACLELRKMSEKEGTRLGSEGSRSTKVYLLRERK